MAKLHLTEYRLVAAVFLLVAIVLGQHQTWAAGFCQDRARLTGPCITAEDLKINAVRGKNIKNSSVRNRHIRDESIDAKKLAPMSVNTSHSEDGTVTGQDIANKTVTGADLSGSIVLGSRSTPGEIGFIDTSGIETIEIRAGSRSFPARIALRNGRGENVIEVSPGSVVGRNPGDIKLKPPVFSLSASKAGGILELRSGDGEKRTITLNGSNGNLEATGLKSFVTPDSNQPGRHIRYTAIEGPEAAMYVRGTAALENGRALVSFPKHFAIPVADVWVIYGILPCLNMARFRLLNVANPSRRRIN